MKKMFLFLAVFMISASSFAQYITIHFTSSCGSAASYTTDAAWASAALTQELIQLNAEMCPGASNHIRVIYS